MAAGRHGIVVLTLAALGTYLLFRRVEMVRGWAKMAGEGEDVAIWPRLTCQLRGPVMLLVLALLFALQAAGIRTIGQTWGVLLIALGALLILERTVGRTPWYPVGPVGTPAAGNSVAPVAPAATRKDGQ